MAIHKEGFKIIAVVFLVLAIINLLAFNFISIAFINWVLCTISFLFFVFILRFFRKPTRTIIIDDNKVFAPCDGQIVVIEQTHENEYFNDKRIQISIFMSVWNVHINWFPVGGIVKYFKYHPGKFLLARLPKSSTENERTTVVVENKNNKQVLFRQIAGIVARRIICYAQENKEFAQNSEVGFIRFGSRVDIFLPLDAKINVEIGQKAVGTKTVIATI
ncbi:MAG: phosphatidylserine decarboxylase [Bacteroidetes bacterium GWA2_31_9b]|nr:MAG: phosphatidylserine decarboxylase [Bacteroidetes bacterium GWA2_31_9b]